MRKHFSMIQWRFAGFLFLLLEVITNAYAQTISLPSSWKFNIGDKPAWALPGFDDAGWETKPIGKMLAAPGQKDHVFAWYRSHISIPQTMQPAIHNGGGIVLSLGKIDDADQVFVNGALVGQTGSFPPNYESKWDVDRYYIVPDSVLLWDKENTIAIRVFSMDAEGLGLVQGAYQYRPEAWFDYTNTQTNFVESANKGFGYNVSFTNKTARGTELVLQYYIEDMQHKKLFTETRQLHMDAGSKATAVVQFSNYTPQGNDIFYVGCEMAAPDGTGKWQQEQVYLSDRNIQIPVGREPAPMVPFKIADIYSPAPLQQQQIDGYLGKRLTQNLTERLLKIDEKGLIEGYLQRPGNHPWIGEHVGKYLESACNAWKYSHDPRLKQQMDRLMYELIHTQLVDGYLGTYTPDQYWTSWDVWSHKYNLYGLLAYYTTTGYAPALETCKKMGDLLCRVFGNGSQQRDIILAGEHMGMAATSVLDPMLELYRYTGDKKYLDFCNYILQAWEQKNGPKIISSLLQTGRVNKVANAKAYEMLSNLVGLAKMYRLTGNPEYFKVVNLAWKDIVANRLYITGTSSAGERFQDDGILPAANSDNIGEGCVTTTWMQLNQQLLSITGKMAYEEEIEKSVYNQLLGAENPQTGCVSYYTSLMEKKPYTCDISCCTSSVPRGIAMVPYFSFGRLNNNPTLLLYEPATYKENIITSDNQHIELKLAIESSFPEKGVAVIYMQPSAIARFKFALRVPGWCKSFTATVGGKTYKDNGNEYLLIDRVWKTSDKIDISFQMPVLQLSGGKSYPGQWAFKRGPQVLALDAGLNKDMLNLFSNLGNTDMKITIPNAPGNTTALPGNWVGRQVYSINIKPGNAQNTGQSLWLVPFADAGQTGAEVRVWMPVSMY
jgi:hypothetical protein